LSVLHNPVTVSMAELCGPAGGERGGGGAGVGVGGGAGGQGVGGAREGFFIFFFRPKLPRTYYGFQDMVGRAREGFFFFFSP
jgi:hypothetical protein